MRKFSKDPDAISRLSPEQYRVTQQSGTEPPEPGSIWITSNRASTSILCRVSRCSHLPTSLNPDAAGLASPSPLNRPASKSCETPRTA